MTLSEDELQNLANEAAKMANQASWNVSGREHAAAVSGGLVGWIFHELCLRKKEEKENTQK